jgi:hypothetical protein
VYPQAAPRTAPHSIPQPVPAQAAVSASQWRNPFPSHIWAGIALAGCVFLLMLFSQAEQARNAPKEIAARNAFGNMVVEVAKESPGVFVGISAIDNDPVIAISDKWYNTPGYVRLRLVDQMGKAWQRCRLTHGLKANGDLFIVDAESKHVASYGHLSGAKLKQE